MKELSDLLKSTESFLAQADENLQKIKALRIGTEIKDSLLSVQEKLAKTNQELSDRKKELIWALVEALPQVTLGAYGIYKTAGASYAEYHVKISEGCFIGELSRGNTFNLDEFVTEQYFQDGYYQLCEMVACRIKGFFARSNDNQTNQIERIMAVVEKLPTVKKTS